MHALLIVVAIVLLVVLAVCCGCARGTPVARHRHVVVGRPGAVWLYFTTDEVPGDFTRMTPYVATLFVLAFASQRLRMPAADGLRYRRGEAAGGLTCPTTTRGRAAATRPPR